MKYVIMMVMHGIEQINDNSRVDQIDNDLNAITNANVDNVVDHDPAKSTSAVLLAEQQADPSLDHAWSLAKRSKSGFFVKTISCTIKTELWGKR